MRPLRNQNDRRGCWNGYNYYLPRPWVGGVGSEAAHASTHTLEDMAASCEYTINASTEELGALKYMPSGREDVISGGAVIWRQILRRVSAANPQLRQVTVSENDILDA